MDKLIVTEKRCSRCKQMLPANHFPKMSRAKNGLASHCKPCRASYDPQFCLFIPPLLGEIWQYTPDSDEYSISSLGRVRRNKGCAGSRAGQLMTSELRQGYPSVNLSIRGTRKHFFIHRLLAQTFLPPPERSEQIFVNHIDGVRHNYSLSNLEWCTFQENVDHAVHVLDAYMRGEQHKMAKLTETSARTIRKLLDEGVQQSQIAIQFHISRPTVSAIKTGRLWKHLI